MTEKPEPLSLTWLFFGFSGRIARQSFALSVLFQLVLLTLLIYHAVKAGEDAGRLVAVGFAMMSFILFLIWSILALSTKRLHDANLPLQLLLLLFIPGINYLFCLFLMVMPSHPEPNEHGPPPFSDSEKSFD